MAWRRGDDPQRERIVSHPQLFSKAGDATAEDDPIDEIDAAQQLAEDLEGASGLCRKARRRLRALTQGTREDRDAAVE